MLGFIGTGNMASAIIRGVITSQMYEGKEIAVFDTDAEKTKALSEKYGVTAFSSAKELAENCSEIVLSVKPNVISSVLSEIDSCAKETNPLLISIAAGKSLEFLSACLSFEARIIRVMPNINASVLEAVSGYCANSVAAQKDKDFVNKLCSCFGTAVEIKEELFPIFSAIAGCSPAFSYMYIDSLARAAVQNGMPKDQALKIAAQAVLGSARMILESDSHPWELVDKVCSPGGTTIEGVCSLQANGFEATVEKAVKASYDKDMKL